MSDLALSKLRAFVKQHKTQKLAAEALGVSQQYVSDLLHGKREFSATMLVKLGLKKIIISA